MFKTLKFWMIVSGIVGSLISAYAVKRVFDKAKERDAFAAENKALKTEKAALRDTLVLQQETLAKALYEAKNAGELYHILKGTTQDFQGVIKVMRDSVIKINKDRVKLETKVLELEKDLERAKKKRKFL